MAGTSRQQRPQHLNVTRQRLPRNSCLDMKRPSTAGAFMKAQRRDTDRAAISGRGLPRILGSRWLPHVGPPPTLRSFRVTTQGNHHAMSDALSYQQAAAILGCHFSNVAKLVRKGQLRSRGRVRDGALDRSEVEALAERRARNREAQAARPRRTYQRVDHRPDADHEWLSPRQVAELLGVTRADGPATHPPWQATGG